MKKKIDTTLLKPGVKVKALVRGPGGQRPPEAPAFKLFSGGQRPPEAPAFKLFWKTHDTFPNSLNTCCKLQIT